MGKDNTKIVALAIAMVVLELAVTTLLWYCATLCFGIPFTFKSALGVWFVRGIMTTKAKVDLK